MGISMRVATTIGSGIALGGVVGAAGGLSSAPSGERGVSRSEGEVAAALAVGAAPIGALAGILSAARPGADLIGGAKVGAATAVAGVLSLALAAAVTN